MKVKAGRFIRRTCGEGCEAAVNYRLRFIRWISDPQPKSCTRGQLIQWQFGVLYTILMSYDLVCVCVCWGAKQHSFIAGRVIFLFLIEIILNSNVI